jgi:hypothetical protein
MSILALVMAAAALVIAVSAAKCVTNMGAAMEKLEKRVGSLEVKHRASRREDPARQIKPVKWEE